MAQKVGDGKFFFFFRKRFWLLAETASSPTPAQSHVTSLYFVNDLTPSLKGVRRGPRGNRVKIMSNSIIKFADVCVLQC